MSNELDVKGQVVGWGAPCFIIAEIGINHNGSVGQAKKLIDIALESGADAVKFQKRTLDVVYTSEELSVPRESVFGATNRDLKQGLEFGFDEYSEINDYCQKQGIMWTASCWDEQSVDFIAQFNPPFFKIASASLTDDNLLSYHRNYDAPVFLSTGMSTLEEIDHAVEILGRENLAILHCTSTYPCALNELNLATIPSLSKRYGIPVGYSGHEVVFIPSYSAALMGACIIERHLTLDRAMWGSDQAASLEPAAFAKLVKYIRAVPEMLGDGRKVVYESEIPVRTKLRRK
jgi:N-acetylneuraminate synthase